MEETGPIYFLLEDLGFRSNLLWVFVSSMWGTPTQGNTCSLIQWFEMHERENRRLSEGPMEEGKRKEKGPTKSIKGREHSSFGILWHIEYILS